MKENGLYVPVYAGIFASIKTRRMARRLGLSVPTAIGHLCALWHAALAHRDDGHLEGWDHQDIADSALFEGDPDLFCEAITDAGFCSVDTQGGWVVLHEWDQYAGGILVERQKKKEAQERWRAAKAGEAKQEQRQAEPAAHDNAKDEPTAKAKKAREPRKSIDDLLALPYKGHETAREYFAKAYPWYDGQPGRMCLDDHYQQMAAWYATKKLKRWETPAAVAAWLDRDTPKAKGMWQRDSGVMPTAAGVVVPRVDDPDEEAKRAAKNRWQILTSLGHKMPATHIEWFRQGCPEPTGEPERANEGRKEPGPGATAEPPQVRLVAPPVAPEGEDDFVPVEQVRGLIGLFGAARQKSAAALKAEQDALRQQRRKG